MDKNKDKNEQKTTKVFVVINNAGQGGVRREVFPLRLGTGNR